VVAGAGATAICADLGRARSANELDAIEVMGLRPVQPARRASGAGLDARGGAGAQTASSLLSVLGGSFIFSIFAQHASAGSFVANLTC